MPLEHRLRRLRFRAWHRGTREADYIVGGFYDRYADSWNEVEVEWFERLVEENDVDIMGWAMGSIAAPEEWEGPMMDALRRLDYVKVL